MAAQADLDGILMCSAQWMWKYNDYRPNMALGGISLKLRLAKSA
jgi:hypothetical protein